MKTEQEALELFCKYFNLRIESMDSLKNEPGYYCRLVADGLPFENDNTYCGEFGVFICYIWESDNDKFYMRDMNDCCRSGQPMELNSFIEHIKETLINDHWEYKVQDGRYIWE
jgi:hypothetical protein